MSDFKDKMHQIRPIGRYWVLHQTPLVELTALPKPCSCIQEAYF